MNKDVWKIAGAVLAIIILSLIILRPRPLQKYRESNQIGSQLISIDMCVDKGADTKRTARKLDDVWQKIRDINTRMSGTSANSDIEKINASYKNPQKVGEDTVFILKESSRYKKMTGGVFDPTVRSIAEVWALGERQNRLPTAQEIADARAAMRLSGIKFLLGNRIEIANPKIRIDLGGIAVGFSVDEAVKTFRKKGIKNFLIDAGGDMYASGHNCSRKPWTIAVRNPEDSSKILDVIQVSDMAVSTAGGFQKTYTIGGQKFSRLIDPSTGYPQKNVIAATVIAPLAVENDVLATSLCILDPNEGIKLIDSMGKKYAAIVISKDKNGQPVVSKSRRYSHFQINKQIKR